MLMDSGGVFWLGTRSGLTKLEKGVFETYTIADGLMSNNIECLLEDDDGTLWIGTDRGLNRFDGQRFVTVDPGGDFSGKACRGLVRDGSFLYVGTATGLRRLNLETLEVEVFTEKDGLAGNEIISRAMVKDLEGNVWIGTIRGLTCFKPALLHPNRIKPYVHIQRVSTLREEIDRSAAIELPHDDNHIRFDFVGLSYASPEDVQYRYRMTGASKEWAETSEHSASYAFLPPGAYTFEVVACNNDGVWSDTPARFSFAIVPPFWMTWWFRMAAILLLAVSLGWAYKIRTIALHKRNEKLEKMIKEREAMSRALSKERTLLRSVIDVIPESICLKDADGVMTLVNKSLAHQWGMSHPRDLIGKTDFDLQPEEVARACRLEDQKVVSTRIPVLNKEIQSRYPTGKQTIELITKIPLISEDDQVAGMVRVNRDVTKEYEMQEQLNQSRKMDAIGQLAGGVAHDFNNMLGGIMGGAEMLESYLPPENETAQKFLSMILVSARRAADLASLLLAFGRKQQESSEATDIHGLITTTVDMLRNTIDKRITVEMDLKAELPVVIGDSAQLQNVFLNLGINASHAMPEGGVLSYTSQLVTIDARYCEDSSFELNPGTYIQVDVHDSGSGISPEDLPHIFEPFFTTKEQGKGTGLGLAASYGTVQQHRGEINVSSRLGHGTRFIVLLPLAESEAAEVRSSATLTQGTGRILMVDDEQSVRITAEGCLKQCGYDVILAENGRVAVEIYREQEKSIDLVICDMMMPEMNGIDCFKALQSINPAVRLILASGFSRAEDLAEMEEMRVAGFIKKPYRCAGLSGLVADVLGRHIQEV